MRGGLAGQRLEQFESLTLPKREKLLDEEEITERLSPHLGRAEIKALLARHDKIIRHFQKMIDENGEAAVLYEVDPPSEKAPWADD